MHHEQTKNPTKMEGFFIILVYLAYEFLHTTYTRK